MQGIVRRACSVLALTALMVAGTALPSGAAPPLAPPDPLAAAKTTLADSQAAAQDAATKYAAAQSEQARLEAEVAKLEMEIPRLKARGKQLRTNVRERAADLYTHDSTGSLLDALNSGDLQDAARATQLTASVADHDNHMIGDLKSTVKRQETQQKQLAQAKVAEDQVVAALAQEQAQLAASLAVAANAWHQLQAIADTQAFLAGAGAVGAAAGRVNTGATLCPVQGPVVFTNDWGQPRSGGRTHKGNDIFGILGTPDIAIVPGTVTQQTGGLGGNAVWLQGDDGVAYYYAHLDSFFGVFPRRVNRGDVVGFLGATGNAAGGASHTHFEIHPGTASDLAVNPFPTLSVLCALNLAFGLTPKP
jgi:murein DD-endopeptidase MepM/ murein hydrolase activator NlpD